MLTTDKKKNYQLQSPALNAYIKMANSSDIYLQQRQEDESVLNKQLLLQYY